MSLEREFWLGRGNEDSTEVLGPLTSIDKLKSEIGLLQRGAEFLMSSPQEMTPQVHSVFTSRLRRAVDGLQNLSTGVVAKAEVEDLEIDLESGLTRKAGSLLQLTPTERKLLLTLGSKPGRLFRHEEILQKVWQTGGHKDSIRVYIERLRRKLGDTDPKKPRYLRTAWGYGYSLLEGILNTTRATVPRENLVFLASATGDLVPEPDPNNRALLKVISTHLGKIALVLRQRYPESKKGKLLVGDLEINLEQMSVNKGGEKIHLTPKELQILILLAKHAKEPVSDLDILRAVWGEEYDRRDLHYIKVYISRMRGKIEEDPRQPQHIKTLWGFGYMLVGEVKQDQASALTQTESLILEALSQKQGDPVPAEEVAEFAQIGVDTYGWPAPHLVNSYIGALRKKLKEGMQIKYVKGRGYRLMRSSSQS